MGQAVARCGLSHQSHKNDCVLLDRGRRIRKAYRRCQARGEIYWVDEEPAETERRLR